MAIGSWRVMPRGPQKQRARREPHIWDQVTKDQLENIQAANEQISTYNEVARNNLSFLGKAVLSVMDSVEKTRREAGQSAKVDE